MKKISYCVEFILTVWKHLNYLTYSLNIGSNDFNFLTFIISIIKKPFN